MKRNEWENLFAGLKPGMLLSEIARRTGASYQSVRIWAVRCGYLWGNGRAYNLARRRNRWRAPWDRISWGQTTGQLLRRYGVSRETVARRRREFAKQAGERKGNQAPI